MKKALSLVLIMLLLVLTACSPAPQQTNENQSKYQSYKDIPGVTQDDIDALEALLAKKPRLVYGTIVSADAFLRTDNTIGGFAALFCERMTQLFGFEFDFYPCAWDELVAKTLSYEIDVVGDLTATEQRRETYIMTDAIAQRTIKIFSNREADDLSVIAKQRPIKCAFLDGGTTYNHISELWDMPYVPIFINDETKVPEMLQSGEIDAFIEEGTLEAVYTIHDFVQAEEFYPLSYSPVSLSTANPEIEPLIRIVQKYLKNNGANELADLAAQGNKDYYEQKLSTILTPQEAEYISRHNTEDTAVLVACETDNYPVSFYNKGDKEFQGSALDVLSQVTALTGLHFKAGNEPGENWPVLLAGLKSGKYSIITEMLKTASREKNFLLPEEPYCIDNYALISRADSPDIEISQIPFAKVGLLEDTAYADIFMEWFPYNLNTISYPNTESAVAALEKGEINLLMSNQNLLLHITNYLEMPAFKTNIVFDYTVDLYLGLNKNEEILCSIIEKAQRFIDTGEITESWKRKTFDYTGKMLKTMLPYTVIFVLVLLAALFIVIVLFIKNKHINKNLGKLVEERTNELALQTSTLTTIFDSIPDIVFCKDTNLCFTRCNNSFEKHFACAEADILGKNDVAGLGMPAEIANAFNEADRRVMREREVLCTEEIIPSVHGDMPFFETLKTPLIKDGEVIGIMGISRNITERKAAEETVKLTLDNINTCIYISDIETGEILFINEKMKEDFGIKDTCGKICWEVFQKGFTGKCEFCPIDILLESGDEYYIWEEHNTVTGRHYKNTDSLIRWHDGKIVHMQHSVDITESVELQRDLEHASRAKSDFLSRMSHEIRTPLNAIIGMIGIAMGTNDTNRVQHCLERADSASKHLLSLINDILDMSKIEAEKFELSYNEFNLEKMLINITNVTHFRAEEKRQNFIVKLDENVPTSINSDELRLSQVITNLLTNAVKFTPEEGTVKLYVETLADTELESELKISVEDNGIGISQEQQSRLFTSFEQADGGIARKFGGTGLGLAISKRIVELMGGKIWIESEFGKGSKFIFTIKVQKGEENKQIKLSEKISRDKLKILAVDDSEDITEYFLQVLSSLNLPCDVASGGQEALKMIENNKEEPYNIFFVDWRMPEMDGIELTKKIKELTAGNAIVFMISASEWELIEKDALDAGVKSFVPKPLFPSSLVNAINTCLESETKKETNLMREPYLPQRKKFNHHTILIAEDIDINREIMSAVLDGSGLETKYAENGREAVELFRESPEKYALILMDIHMPEMDGYGATKAIRALDIPRAKEIPIIAMTANVFKEDIDNCLESGMNDHTGKPIDADDLFRKLDKYLPD